MHSEMVEQLQHPPIWDSDSESGRMSRPELAHSTSEFTEDWRRLPYDRVSNASESYSYSSSHQRRRMMMTVMEQSADPVEESAQQQQPSDRSSSTSTDSSREQRPRRVPYERVSSSGSESGASHPDSALVRRF